MKYRILSPIALLSISLLSIVTLAHSAPVSGIVEPLAAFTYEPCLACAVIGFATFFNANSSASLVGAISSYTWDFGDGTPLVTTTSPEIFHDFFFSKSFVTLTVKDSTGLTNSVGQVFIWASVPRFSFQPTIPSVGETVTFNASASRVYTSPFIISSFQWDFGDGSSSSGIITSHAYSAPGLHRVSLTLVTANGNPTVSKTILVMPLNRLLSVTFEGLNITVSGSFTVNATARTVVVSATVLVINNTSGATIFSKSFNISLSFVSSSILRLVLKIPVLPLTLAVDCTVNVATRSANCTASRDPDINHDGTVDLNDVFTVILAWGTTPSSKGWNPAADLNANGIVDLNDVLLAAIYWGAPVFS